MARKLKISKFLKKKFLKILKNSIPTSIERIAFSEFGTWMLTVSF